MTVGSRHLAPIAALLFVSLSCGSNGKDAPKPEADAPKPQTPVAARPAELTSLRPQLKFSDGRTSHAGVAFMPASSKPIVILPTHVVIALLRGGQLTALDFVDAQTKAVLGHAIGLALPPGAPMDTLDFSTDFGCVVLDSVPAGVARLGLDPERAKVGDTVDVLACPTDGASPQITISAQVTYSGSRRLDVTLDQPGNPRGITGSPIVSRRTGLVVGVLQMVQVNDGTVGLGRATPAEAIRPKLAEAEAATSTVPLSTWSVK